MDFYYASTPFNILMTILVKESRKEAGDIVVSDFAPANYDIYLRLKNTNIFSNVYYAPQKKYELIDSSLPFIKKIYTKIKLRFKNRFLFRKIVAKDCPSFPLGSRYDEMFFDTTNYTQRAFFFSLKKNNKNLKFFKIDCGIESYFDRDGIKYPFKRLRDTSARMSRYCQGSYLLDKRFTLFNNYALFDIDKRTIDYSIIDNIFNYETTDLLKSSDGVVFFDQKFDRDDDSLKQENAAMITKNFFDNMVVKLHPRSEINVYKDLKCEKTKSTFEMIVLNNRQADFDNMVFITFSSTAVFLPKMLLDKEPYIISLMNLIDVHFNEENEIRLFIDKAKEIYSSHNKIFVPSSIEELKEVLENVRNSRKQER